MTNSTQNPLDPTSTHTHSSRCWWNHLEARWQCDTGARPHDDPSAGTTDDAVAEVDAAGVDTRDMVVVHTALLRELRLAPRAVERVGPGDRKQARRVEQHLALLCELLHHHHTGEDELLWPVLRPRLSGREAALLDVAEAQHAGIDHALETVGTRRATWVTDPTAEARDDLAAALVDLHRLLAEHLEAEERQLLPLAAAHLSAAEWHAVGEAGAASVPKPALPLVFGMFAYEGDPEVLATMLASAPLVPRVLVPRIAPRIYARRALAVHGTRRP